MKVECLFSGFGMMRVLLFCQLLHLCRFFGGEASTVNADCSVDDEENNADTVGMEMPEPLEKDVGGGQEGGSGQSSTEDREGADLSLFFMCGHEPPAQD